MEFNLRAIRAHEAPTNIIVDAQSPNEALRSLEEKGYKVLSVSSASSANVANKNTFPLLLFIQELSMLIESGLQLQESLEVLLKKESKSQNKFIIFQVAQSVREGRSFSDALEKFSKLFPVILIGTIRASETTGNLIEALKRFILYQEQINVIRKKIISASLYPMVVLSVGFLVIIFLLAFVVPRFSKIYNNNVNQLSATTEILIKIGYFFDHGGLYFIGAFILLTFVTFRFYFRSRAKYFIIGFFRKLPYLGERIHVYYLSQFYRTFSMLLKSGIPINKSLMMMSDYLIPELKLRVTEAINQINEGQGLASSFENQQLTTSVSLRLFQVGEKTGNLDVMMEKAATFHEEQVFRWVDSFMKLFEPILMAIIGFIVGAIVILLYLPIFELVNTIQ